MASQYPAKLQQVVEKTTAPVWMWLAECWTWVEKWVCSRKPVKGAPWVVCQARSMIGLDGKTRWALGRPHQECVDENAIEEVDSQVYVDRDR